MAMPERYKEIVDFFEGAAIMAELTDGNKIAKNKLKTNNALFLNFETTLRNDDNGAAYRFDSFFKKETKYEGYRQVHRFYFPFVISLDRFKDEVSISTILPGVAISNPEFQFVSQHQIEKMFKNAYILDLLKLGLTDVSLERTKYAMYQIKGALDKNHGGDSVSKLYNFVNNYNTKAFKILNI